MYIFVVTSINDLHNLRDLHSKADAMKLGTNMGLVIEQYST